MTTEETNTRFIALIGYGNDYGSDEARLALAIADAGGGGGGGGTSAGTIASGIDLSADIELIKNSLDSIDTNTSPLAGTYADFSGAVTSTPATVKSANVNRTYFEVQNIGTVENLYVRFGATASATTGFVLFPGGSLQSDVPQQVQQSISIVSAGSGTNYFGFALE